MEIKHIAFAILVGIPFATIVFCICYFAIKVTIAYAERVAKKYKE